MLEVLPAERAGTCVLDRSLRLYRGTLDTLRRDVAAQAVRFHAGRLQGAFPEVLPG